MANRRMTEVAQWVILIAMLALTVLFAILVGSVLFAGIRWCLGCS